MGCATSLVKMIVFIFNFIFALCGLALLVIGVLILKDVKDYDELLHGKFHAPPILLIVVGSIIFVVAFFGFCGALRESHCMLCTYVVLLLTLFVVQVVAGALAFAYRDDTQDMMFDKIDKYVSDYQKYRETMDSIQINVWKYNGFFDVLLKSCFTNLYRHLLQTLSALVSEEDADT